MAARLSARADVQALAGWTPFRAAWHGDRMLVDWCHLGARRFCEPFFYETVALAMTQPFNLVFSQRTGIAILGDLPRGLRPSGFIFHMARCGSTLCAQALAADPRNIVMSEAVPIRAVLRAAQHGPATRFDIASWLEGMVNAFARPRFDDEARFFVKFMAADALDLPLIRRVFPDVPWLFLYRDPLEILASQKICGGADTVRGQIPPERLGLTAEALAAMTPYVYQSHVIAALGRAALAAWETGQGLLLDYRDLPDALTTDVAAHFCLALNEADRETMRLVAARDAKRPAAPFVANTEAKRRAAMGWRDMVDAIAGDTIDALRCASRRSVGLNGRLDLPQGGSGPTRAATPSFATDASDTLRAK